SPRALRASSSLTTALSAAVGDRQSNGRSSVLQPDEGLQIPHGSHGRGPPPVHIPCMHASSIVQALPSLHDIPSDAMMRQLEEQHSVSYPVPASQSSPEST